MLGHEARGFRGSWGGRRINGAGCPGPGRPVQRHVLDGVRVPAQQVVAARRLRPAQFLDHHGPVVGDLDDTELVSAFGGTPLWSRRKNMSHPSFMGRMESPLMRTATRSSPSTPKGAGTSPIPVPGDDRRRGTFRLPPRFDRRPVLLPGILAKLRRCRSWDPSLPPARPGGRPESVRVLPASRTWAWCRRFPIGTPPRGRCRSDPPPPAGSSPPNPGLRKFGIRET